MKKEISNTLKIGSTISTILVVAIHYNSIAAIPADKGITLNFFIQQFITVGLGRFAVPWFALLAGFFSGKNDKGFRSYGLFLIKRGKTLLLPYVIAAYFIFWTTSLIAILLRDSDALSVIQIISWSKGILAHPSVQLWYLRDLFVLSLALPLLIKSPGIFRIFLSCIFGVLWFLEIQALPLLKGWYLVSIETLFFFTFGGLIHSMDLSGLKRFLRVDIFAGLVLIWISLVISRIFIKPDFSIWYSTNYDMTSLILYKLAILVGLIMLFMFSFFYREKKLVIYLSGFNFFVYLYHFYPLFYFRRITQMLIPVEYSFYGDLILALIISYGTAWILNRYLPKIFSIITGMRIPEKENL